MVGDARAQVSPDGGLPLPSRFGANYTLFDRIGAGGMAEIYLAREKTRVGAPRLAVVKLILPHLASDQRFANLLIAEAKLAAQLSHANIVQTYNLGREQERLYIAMEYVEGFDINELLRRCSKARVALPAEFAFLLIGEVLRALEYAHKKRGPDGVSLSIVHRDVSPSNVLISFEGEVKLCDFGIARATSIQADSPAETVEGKASYMSPEHARGEAIDGRSDVFSASVILWELLAGRRMYRAREGKDLLTLAREADVPALPDRGLPDHARLSAIVMKGLAAHPDQRYPTALAMARDLDAYLMAHRMRPSPLKLGEFLMEHFGNEIVETRRARERSSITLDQHPVPEATSPSIDNDFDEEPDTLVTDRSTMQRLIASQPRSAPEPAFVAKPHSHPQPAITAAATRATSSTPPAPSAPPQRTSSPPSQPQPPPQAPTRPDPLTREQRFGKTQQMNPVVAQSESVATQPAAQSHEAELEPLHDPAAIAPPNARTVALPSLERHPRTQPKRSRTLLWASLFLVAATVFLVVTLLLRKG